MVISGFYFISPSTTKLSVLTPIAYGTCFARFPKRRTRACCGFVNLGIAAGKSFPVVAGTCRRALARVIERTQLLASRVLRRGAHVPDSAHHGRAKIAAPMTDRNKRTERTPPLLYDDDDESPGALRPRVS